MSTIDDIGYEIVKVPVSKVRVSHYKHKWFVEYRLKKSKFGIDRWWWYDDSTHATYLDAVTRAQVLSALGYYEIIAKKNKIEFNCEG
jgi:hypothetical protein